MHIGASKVVILVLILGCVGYGGLRDAVFLGGYLADVFRPLNTSVVLNVNATTKSLFEATRNRGDTTRFPMEDFVNRADAPKHISGITQVGGNIGVCEASPPKVSNGRNKQNNSSTVLAASVTHAYHPTTIREEISLNVLTQRGNLHHAFSGLKFAVWYYPFPFQKNTRKNDHAIAKAPQNRMLRNATSVQPYDTVYVTFSNLPHFANNMLSLIDRPFVLITNQMQNVLDPKLKTGRLNPLVFEQIVNHSCMARWFMANIYTYATYPLHPKLSPYPIGIHPAKVGPLNQILMEQQGRSVNKTRHYYASALGSTSESRKGIPSAGRRASFEKYIHEIQQSHYVLSPNGDRPECYRHYEALAMGTIPVTELDPRLHRHLKGAIFNNSRWDDQYISSLPTTSLTRKINRRIAYSEYWMEYMDAEVGHPLWWIDEKGKRIELPELTTRLRNYW